MENCSIRCSSMRCKHPFKKSICVLVSGVGLDVHVASLAVANAQKPDGSHTHQLGCRPKPFSGKRTTCLVVNQANQIQLVGHRRELATDGMPSQKESTVHDRNFAIETTGRTMNFQRTANSVLTVCLTSGGRFRTDEYDFGNYVLAHSGEESLEGFDGSLFAYPKKAGNAQINLVDQGEVFVSFGILNFID